MKYFEWWAQVQCDGEVLIDFIMQWHPRAQWAEPPESWSVAITAPNAEGASRSIREAIKKEGEALHRRVVEMQLIQKDPEFYNLLNGAWFGVPESTSCWELPGFREAVALLEDPPEEE